MPDDIDLRKLVKKWEVDGVNIALVPTEVEVGHRGFFGAMVSLVSGGGVSGGYGRYIRARFAVIATRDGSSVPVDQLVPRQDRILEAAEEITGQPRKKLEFTIAKSDAEDQRA